MIIEYFPSNRYNSHAVGGSNKVTVKLAPLDGFYLPDDQIPNESSNSSGSGVAFIITAIAFMILQAILWKLGVFNKCKREDQEKENSDEIDINNLYLKEPLHTSDAGDIYDAKECEEEEDDEELLLDQK